MLTHEIKNEKIWRIFCQNVHVILIVVFSEFQIWGFFNRGNAAEKILIHNDGERVKHDYTVFVMIEHCETKGLIKSFSGIFWLISS